MEGEEKMQVEQFLESFKNKKRGKVQCTKTGTTPGSRVQVPDMGRHEQIDLGHTNKYPHKAAIPGPAIELIA